jgi:hypothetical protein
MDIGYGFEIDKNDVVIGNAVHKIGSKKMGHYCGPLKKQRTDKHLAMLSVSG